MWFDVGDYVLGIDVGFDVGGYMELLEMDV